MLHQEKTMTIATFVRAMRRRGTALAAVGAATGAVAPTFGRSVRYYKRTSGSLVALPWRCRRH